MNNTITNYLGQHNLHVRITEVPEVSLEEIKIWIMSESKIKVCIGSLETGEAGSRHWQLTASCSVAHSAMRNKLKNAFPQLVGARGQKGIKYYIKPVTSWENSCSYCLKEIQVVEDNPNLIMKGMTFEQVQGIPKWIEPVKGHKTFITMLCEHVREHACMGNKLSMGISILRYFLEKKKTLPNKWKLREYISTCEVMLAGDDQNDLLEGLVNEALNF